MPKAKEGERAGILHAYTSAEAPGRFQIRKENAQRSVEWVGTFSEDNLAEVAGQTEQGQSSTYGG